MTMPPLVIPPIFFQTNIPLTYIVLFPHPKQIETKDALCFLKDSQNKF